MRSTLMPVSGSSSIGPSERPSDDGNLIRIHRLRTLLTGGNFQEIDGKSIVSIFAASPWLEQV
ncbi:hypothetical protein J2W22_004537 [Sphingomonas kyeonggiensis]|nr:hypothetical protein [Sphingomonas kyeonggiensis]